MWISYWIWCGKKVNLAFFFWKDIFSNDQIEIFRTIIWRYKLSDSIMNMITYKSQTDSVNKIYCGLASGNLVVLEVDI